MIHTTLEVYIWHTEGTYQNVIKITDNSRVSQSLSWGACVKTCASTLVHEDISGSQWLTSECFPPLLHHLIIWNKVCVHCYCMCACIAITHMRRWESNSRELIVTLYQVGSGNWPRVIKLRCRLLSHWATLSYFHVSFWQGLSLQYLAFHTAVGSLLSGPHVYAASPLPT